MRPLYVTISGIVSSPVGSLQIQLGTQVSCDLRQNTSLTFSNPFVYLSIDIFYLQYSIGFRYFLIQGF